MVNLIITLISIALIAAVAVAALYNGGDAFRQGSAKSSAAQLVNAGQQISAANVLYANDNGGSYATTVGDLTSGGAYLSSIPRVPEGFTLTDTTPINGNTIAIEADSEAVEICEATNVQAGEGSTSLSSASDVDKGFGCFVEDGAAVFVFGDGDEIPTSVIPQ